MDYIRTLYNSMPKLHKPKVNIMIMRPCKGCMLATNRYTHCPVKPSARTGHIHCKHYKRVKVTLLAGYQAVRVEHDDYPKRALYPCEMNQVKEDYE